MIFSPSKITFSVFYPAFSAVHQGIGRVMTATGKNQLPFLLLVNHFKGLLTINYWNGIIFAVT